MSKKRKPTAKKTLPNKTQQAARTKRTRATAERRSAGSHALASAVAATTTAEATPPDAATSRLPPIGTLITKRDRYGAIRCQCTVVEDGIRYQGRVFRSLSGAAMAAAKDLGLTNPTQNGYTFWGLTKPTRTLADPAEALGKA